MTGPNNHTAALAHYIIHAGPRHMGATRLNKVLWFADIIAYRRRGRSLTGAESYRRMQHGPVPHGIDTVLNNLKVQGAVSEEGAPTLFGVRREFLSRRAPDVSCFSPEDIALIHEVMTFVLTHNAAEISEQTHDALWDEIENGQDMSVAAASVFPAEITEEDFDLLDKAPSHS